MLIPLDLVCGLTAIAVWLLKRMKLKGILLTVGATLFVISKSILVVNLVRELHIPFKPPFT